MASRVGTCNRLLRLLWWPCDHDSIFGRSGDAPGFPYGDKVVFLANDWHAGLVPTYVAGKYRQHGVYKVRSLWTIVLHDQLPEGLHVLAGAHAQTSQQRSQAAAKMQFSHE